jgi:hypothetical protein
MQARRAPWSATALLLLVPVTSASRQVPSGTRIVFHESPVIDLYYHVRVAKDAAEDEAFAAASRAAQALDRALGGQALAWGPLDGRLSGCETAADLRAAFASAPEKLTLRGGTEIELRKGALELADALLEAEAAFAPLWEARRSKLRAARSHWESAVGAKEKELLALHLELLGMNDPGIELPVFLVTEAPWPGALTVFDEQRRGVSFVAVSAGEGSKFLEIVLHEVTHSLDIASGERSAFGELRARMAKAGLERDRRLGDPAHTLMFVQSAESIRRVLDPSHQDYGERERVYARLGESATLVRGLWSDHLEGKLTRDEALDGIVAGLAPAAK